MTFCFDSVGLLKTTTFRDLPPTRRFTLRRSPLLKQEGISYRKQSTYLKNKGQVAKPTLREKYLVVFRVNHRTENRLVRLLRTGHSTVPCLIFFIIYCLFFIIYSFYPRKGNYCSKHLHNNIKHIKGSCCDAKKLK